MDTVSAYRIAAQYLTARALSMETLDKLALTPMTDDQLLCRLAADAAEDRLAHERNWTTSSRSEYRNLVAELETGAPKETKETKETKQQMITQVLRIEIAHYRALALIADGAYWQTIREEATRILASKIES
jgi:hypothetical protein